MSGILFPKYTPGTAPAQPGPWLRVREIIRSNRLFLILVLLPTLLVALYYSIFASNQYQSSADFVVRRADSAKTGADFGSILGFGFGANSSLSEAYLVEEYLLSHDVVKRLQKENDLVGVFTRPGVDWVSRMWSSEPTPENLLKFFNRQVEVKTDDVTGISHLSVRTFRPQDSQTIALAMLKAGEERINAINAQTYRDQVANAKLQFEVASRNLSEVEAQLTAYRLANADPDPANSGRAQIELVSGLTESLVAARAKLATMSGAISHSSPQYQAMVRQVQTLEAQVAAENAKIGGPKASLASRLGDYEHLVVKQTEAAQVYTAASINYKQAQADAMRKQLYLVRVVEPNTPVKSEYPKRFQIVLTVFATLFLAYAIGWLLLAGIKEHSL